MWLNLLYKTENVHIVSIIWLIRERFTFLNEAIFLHKIPSVKGGVIQDFC